MRALLMAYGATDRRVWGADSFAGLPPGTPERAPADSGSNLHKIGLIAVSLEEVKKELYKIQHARRESRFSQCLV